MSCISPKRFRGKSSSKSLPSLSLGFAALFLYLFGSFWYFGLSRWHWEADSPTFSSDAWVCRTGELDLPSVEGQ